MNIDEKDVIEKLIFKIDEISEKLNSQSQQIDELHEVIKNIGYSVHDDFNNLFKKIVLELEEMHEAGTSFTQDRGDQLFENIKKLNGYIDEHIDGHMRLLIQEINESERKIKMSMPGSNRNTY